jgi:hypothetical protein
MTFRLRTITQRFRCGVRDMQRCLCAPAVALQAVCRTPSPDDDCARRAVVQLDAPFDEWHAPDVLAAPCACVEAELML